MPRRKYPKTTWSDSKKAYRATLPIDGKRRDIYGKTPDEVLDKIDMLLDDTTKTINRKTTLNEFSSLWLKTKLAGLKPNSRAVYINALDVHILPTLGKLLLCDIKPLHIDNLFAALTVKSSSMRSKIMFTLSQIFESAIENDIIEKNPCRNKKAGGTPAKTKVPLTQEEQNTLCNAVKDKRCELFVLLCLYAGLRREEALGLLWSNVHLDGTPYINVRHTVTFTSKGKQTHSEALKSGAAYRSIPIPPILSEALIRYKAKTSSMFVIPAERTGEAMSLSSFKRMWDIVKGYTYTRKDSNGKLIKHEVPGVVSFHVEPHQLRHTYITELCSSGIDIKKIQYLAGHADVKMTLNIYSHVTQNKPEQLYPAIITAFGAGKNAGN